MSKLLFLAHRIPYPPNKGDKIRSYHLLKHLAARHRVYLGSFVDDEHDWQYRGEVEKLCAQVFLRPLNPRLAKLKSALGLLTGEALSLPYYRDAALRHWVAETLKREGMDRIVVYCSSMAQYVDGPAFAGCKRVLDLVDVDSDKWRQYAEKQSGPMAWVYGRESRALLKYERGIAARFDASLFVSAAEAALFRELAPEVDGKVSHYDNGVDTAYFDPALSFDNPYGPGGPVLVFTGAMDYWANVEAVSWFAENVFPRIRAARPDARFYIVGSKPTEAVRALGQQPGITVTGRVEDVRPYVRHAALAIAPLRIARGIQNKVLEALAMARTVLCTPAAAEGLQAESWLADCVHEDAEALAAAALARLDGRDNPAGRDYVLRHYSWDSHLARVDHLLA
ncbi:MAG: TIGR03087 family PEP-CTERM/XrtA system glycosyltransferase [Gammaproteobacteria bacterium]|nr:TIGR03087 family PEP-CTERM/XrtA system glycosyltransferase [Gammaproteobacteria bacterium]